MRRLFGCSDIVSLTEKFWMARNFFWIFTENNPVMRYSKTFFIPEAKGLRSPQIGGWKKKSGLNGIRCELVKGFVSNIWVKNKNFQSNSEKIWWYIFHETVKTYSHTPMHSEVNRYKDHVLREDVRLLCPSPESSLALFQELRVEERVEAV